MDIGTQILCLWFHLKITVWLAWYLLWGHRAATSEQLELPL